MDPSTPETDRRRAQQRMARVRLVARALARDPRRAGWAWSAALGLWLLDILVRRTHLTWHPSVDPSHHSAYFMGIARYVRDGAGLLTDVSLAHQGLPALPFATPHPPLWPLLLGGASALVPLEHLATLLPAALYLLALALAHELGRRVVPDALAPALAPGLHAGHVWMVTLGTHGALARHAASPLPELLALPLAIAALWRLWSAWARPSLGRGARCGLWLGACALTSPHAAPVWVAALCAAALAPWRDSTGRRARLHLAAGMFATFASLVAARWLHLRASMGPVSPLVALGLVQPHLTPALPPLEPLFSDTPLPGYLIERLRGLASAWSPTDTNGFARAFHGLNYALPLAAVLALAERLRRPRPPAGAPRIAEDAPRGARFGVGWLLLGAAGLLYPHLLHPPGHHPWVFADLAALPAAAAFAGATIWLLRRRTQWMAAIALAVFLGSGALGLQSSARHANRIQRKHPGRRYKSKLVRHLWRERDRRDAPLVIAMYQPERISLYTRGAAGYHAIERDVTRVEDLVTMVRELGVTHLILPARRRGWRWRGSLKLHHAFRQTAAIDRLVVMRPVAGIAGRPSQAPEELPPAARAPAAGDEANAGSPSPGPEGTERALPDAGDDDAPEAGEAEIPDAGEAEPAEPSEPGLEFDLGEGILPQ